MAVKIVHWSDIDRDELPYAVFLQASVAHEMRAYAWLHETDGIDGLVSIYHERDPSQPKEDTNFHDGYTFAFSDEKTAILFKLAVL